MIRKKFALLTYVTIDTEKETARFEIGGENDEFPLQGLTVEVEKKNFAKWVLNVSGGGVQKQYSTTEKEGEQIKEWVAFAQRDPQGFASKSQNDKNIKPKKPWSKKRKITLGAIALIIGFAIFGNEDEDNKESSSEPAQEVSTQTEETKQEEKKAEKPAEKALALTVSSHDQLKGKTKTDTTEYKVKTEPEANVKLQTVVFDKVQNEYTATADSQGVATFSIATPRTENLDTIAYVLDITAEKEGKKSDEVKASLTRTLSDTEKKAFIEKNAKTPEYAQLKKAPDKYVGTRAVYKGQVLEAQESNGMTVMRIAVTYAGYDIWDFNDVIMVKLDGTTEAVQDDIVKVYGALEGDFSYTSQAGWDITVPLMSADFAEVVQ